MNPLIRSLLVAAALSALCVPSLTGASADVGPRPPITTQEVKDPQNHLAMRHETVNISIDGHRAHVNAFFHFEAPTHYRTTLAMRLGFPELTADSPLQAFTVKQRVYPRGTTPQGWDAVTDLRTQPVGSGLPDNLAATWKTWGLRLVGHHGAPRPEDVDTQVSYDQNLTKVKGQWRYTYVLRSGAPWKDPIGKAEVKITVKNAQIVSALPSGGKINGDTITWSMENFEPTQDISVVVK